MEYDFDLREYNTFGLPCVAKEFLRVKDEDDLYTLSDLYHEGSIFILGFGANVIFSQEKTDKVVAKIENKGLSIISENKDFVCVEVAAGELWDDFIDWATRKNLSGIENLAGIPSSVGASPVQNIGAYGMEAKDSVYSVTCFDLEKKAWQRISNKDCKFEYRNSIFKHQKGNLLIWKVCFRLQRKFSPNINYKDIENKINSEQIRELSPSFIANIVREIRNKKLPDYKVFGNVGSFFKNPVISKEHYLRLSERYPNIVAFDEKQNKKISAAWLIEQCGFKGKRIGNVGMHISQALVMINYGNASGNEVLLLAKNIQQAVKQKFDINLQIEAHII